MPVMSLTRPTTSVLSLLILGAAAYLLWNWQEGAIIVKPDGDLLRMREDWRLWIGLGSRVGSFPAAWW